MAVETQDIKDLIDRLMRAQDGLFDRVELEQHIGAFTPLIMGDHASPSLKAQIDYGLSAIQDIDKEYEESAERVFARMNDTVLKFEVPVLFHKRTGLYNAAIASSEVRPLSVVNYVLRLAERVSLASGARDGEEPCMHGVEELMLKVRDHQPLLQRTPYAIQNIVFACQSEEPQVLLEFTSPAKGVDHRSSAVLKEQDSEDVSASAIRKLAEYVRMIRTTFPKMDFNYQVTMQNY